MSSLPILYSFRRCPYAMRARLALLVSGQAVALREVVLRDKPDVRLVIKEFPILSQSSLVAAQAAIAAEMQGKFVDYHIGMMTYRGQITNDVVMRVAEQAGLDNTQLQKDMESVETAAIIQRTREAAAALALNGTPALVIGDTVVPGAIGLDELVGLIADERAKQG